MRLDQTYPIFRVCEGSEWHQHVYAYFVESWIMCSASLVGGFGHNVHCRVCVQKIQSHERRSSLKKALKLQFICDGKSKKAEKKLLGRKLD